jgi:hypothetical protein
MASSAEEMAESRVEVRILVDEDDPSLPAYQAFGLDVFVMPKGLGFSGTLNEAAKSLWHNPEHILGAFGDDVIFRTPGWDTQIMEALKTPGIAYGDDLIHGVNHPSAVFMSAPIAKALGWLALPASKHQWVDDGWKRLGEATNTLRFVPIVVEHMHPAVGKAEMDEGYQRVFDGENAKRDYEGFTDWVENGGLHNDTLKVRMAVYGRVE